MIENETQYRITKIWIGRFNAVLTAHIAAGDTRPNVDALMVQAERFGIRSQLETMLREVDEYERKRAKL